MHTNDILNTLRAALPDLDVQAGTASDQPTLDVPAAALVAACEILRDAPELRFAFLSDITAVDLIPRAPRFEVIYHLACLGPALAGLSDAAAPKRLRLKVRVTDRIPTVSHIWPSAGWPEREVYDMFGIVFDGHPDLRRILMPEDWEGHPLRKDYDMPLEYHGVRGR